MELNEEIVKRWKPLLEVAGLPPITDARRRSVTATLLENTEKAIRETGSYNPRSLLEAGVPTNVTGSSIDNYDPVLISMVRRTMPNIMAYDVCGVQPMTGPTGLIFAMRSRYTNQSGAETFYNEVNTAYSSVLSGANTIGNKNVGTLPGTTSVTANLAEEGIYNFGGGMSTAQSEALGASGNTAIPQMSFSIESMSVTAKSRALKAEYSQEMAQDLRAIHGLDAETELANILTTEILAEINREVIRTIAITATRGANTGTTTSGIFDLDTDSNGRWSVEKFKGLMFHLERECNQISRDTRRGKGNIMICSSDVASAMQMAGILDYTPALNSNQLNVDDTGNTFAGVLNGRLRVYIDPYAEGGNYAVVGYKGPSTFDAGIFYCPYVPLQMVRAVGEDNFQPRIAFKTRYGMVANPFAEGITAGNGALTKDSNKYYRRILVTNLM